MAKKHFPWHIPTGCSILPSGSQNVNAMVSEKSSNKKVSLLTNRNLISDCQVSLLTHLETDHSLMSSCGGRRWNILCNIASVLWRYTSTWTLRVALWCRCPSIIPLAGRLVSDHCLHTWVPTSAWDFPKLISPSLPESSWVEMDYCLSPGPAGQFCLVSWKLLFSSDANISQLPSIKMCS